VAANDNGHSSPPEHPTTPPVGPPPPPAAGWEIPREPAEPTADVFAQLSELLHEFVPEELQKRIADAVRELLVALRTLIDWLAELLERRPGGPGATTEVRDIPIL
jgi:hypothetical protein